VRLVARAAEQVQAALPVLGEQDGIAVLFEHAGAGAKWLLFTTRSYVKLNRVE
jgi:hypothetical protein